MNGKQKTTIALRLLLSVFSVTPFFAIAETVSGNGYVVQQTIAPVQGALSGNGYVLQQSSQQTGGSSSGGGSVLTDVFGTAPQAPSGGGGGGGSVITSGGGSGFYVLPFTPSTTTPYVPKTPDVILTDNGSTCKTRVIFSSPIDVGASTNNKEDVKKLEMFLNTYENEKLPVNGIYENRDVVAVKKWQQKYQSFILAPMRLKKPTGTIYSLSQRQIERQTTASCGQPIKVTSCPFFKTYTKYGDRGDEVKRVQQFLNIVQGEKLTVSGVYGPLTREAVKRFQREHKKDVVSFVTLDFISGNWNVSTRTKANEVIGCDILK